MDWLQVLEIIYIPLIVIFSLEIIYNMRSSSKTLAYLLLIIFLPVVGILFYLSFGINYRKNKIYSKKLEADKDLEEQINHYFEALNIEAFESRNPALDSQEKVARFLTTDAFNPVSLYNKVKLLHNGEETLAEIKEALKQAKKTIHLEYYILEDDRIGNEIKDILIERSLSGVEVRVIYDDFGSSSIRRRFRRELQAAGVEIYPFLKIIFIRFANRINYRNHRKIIIIDGRIAFTGGINIADRYINRPNQKKVFWRDTHLRIEGYACYSLQHLFLCDWNFCADQYLGPNQEFFPYMERTNNKNQLVQIASCGPDSTYPTIMYALMQAIAASRREIFISTPYFIPTDNILSVLKVSAMSGVRIRLLVPYDSDSRIANAASSSYYEELMDVGVEIYRYKKGFIHSKTFVCDRELGMVGSANLDIRSFDLNFEVNALIYDKEFAEKMAGEFLDDLKDAERIDPQKWAQRSNLVVLAERIARLGSSLL